MEKERRKRLASLPFSEKLKILERLRDRSRAIAASGLRKRKVRQAIGKPGESRGLAEWRQINVLTTLKESVERSIEGYGFMDAISEFLDEFYLSGPAERQRMIGEEPHSAGAL